MSRAALVVLLAAFASPACQVTLRFGGPPDASARHDAGPPHDAAHDAPAARDSGQDAPMTHDAGQDAPMTHDAGPDAPAAGGCETDDDCPLASLHCDAISGQCLACVSDGDCAATAGRPRCDAALHICVQCGTDQDCPSGGKCSAPTRSCVKTCAINTDCGATGVWCDDGICAQCDDDHHCAGTRPYCDLTRYQCVACVTDSQCSGAAGTPHCNRTTGGCVGCMISADCATGLACDPADWTCKTPAR